MRNKDFLKIASGLFSVAYATLILLRPYAVLASSSDIYGGAAGIMKDAINTIENGEYVTDSDSDEIESPEEVDLTGNILNGISIGEVDISGDTYNEAISEVDSYVSSIAGTKIRLNSIDGHSTEVTASGLGMKWNDTDKVKSALLLGRDGNIVDRYKERKDLEHEKKVYPLNLDFDRDLITALIQQQSDLYSIEAVDGTISKADGDFTITPGQTGQTIDVPGSVSKVLTELDKFDGSEMVIDLKVITDEPKGNTADLEKIHDIIGAYKTSFSSSGRERSGNVTNGTSLVDGTVLFPGDQFSMYNTVSPFTEENGYYLAGSYLNGMVVESLGGGICQVSSTLYNAVLRAELQVDERYNHSMIVSYVDLSSDAAISGTSKDFKFTNNKDYPIYIEGYTTSDKQVVFNIYGIENRPDNRTVSFESVKTSETIPDTEKIVADPSKPIGYVSVQSAHTGYTGELWKIVTVDGTQTERTQVNKSNYLPSPKTATVGTATDNPTALAMVQTAIATGSIDYVRSVVNELNAMASAAAAQ